MSKYRKKPIEVNAWKVGDLIQAADINWKDLPKPILDEYEKGNVLFFHKSMTLLKGEIRYHYNLHDWLIQSPLGELYCCPPQEFAITYEAVIE